MKFCLSISALASLDKRAFKNPSNTKEAGVSPGCTLELINIIGLLPFNALGVLVGNNPGSLSSLIVCRFSMPVIVTSSIYLLSGVNDIVSL
mmetsp:Transcript_29342/g.5304  ORF Transcript_29342/g.5304 Transcript_29342/m.5304 type:complete len:91 (-) Transcript_29342:76-348(-)